MTIKRMIRGLGLGLGLGLGGLAVLSGDGLAESGPVRPDQPAKLAFSSVALPNAGPPAAYGSYARGCMAGAVALPVDGPTWQAMRLSRNRRWGNPAMIALVQQLSRDAVKIGWPGLLVGDVSQPRGGPMLTGHASHQIGLDADIWLTPMPKKRLTAQQREELPFTSLLEKDKFLTVRPDLWTPTHARLLLLAASYPQVERIFVNPAIKKKLCETWTGNRAAMGKIRPIYGHDAHFHIRLACPAGPSGCKPQAPVPPGDGCDASLSWWFTQAPWAKPKQPPASSKPAPPPRPIMVSDLPRACAVILDKASVGTAAVRTQMMPPADDEPAVGPVPGEDVPQVER